MNSSNEKIKIMRDEEIPKALLKLGIPTMIGMLINALYNVVDAYFVGGLGTSQMGAVSISFPIGQIIIGLAMTYGSGAASYISRLLGEGNDRQANRTASTALFSSLITGIIIITLFLCFIDNILVTLGATKTIFLHARMYAVIYIAGSILNIINVTMNNIVTSEGMVKFTMISMLLGGGLNVVLDPIFIYSLGFGIQGAAIATVISQGATTLLYIGYILEKKGHLRFTLHDFILDKTIYSQIFKIGIPTLVFQLLTSTSIGLINTAASKYGDYAVAAMGIVTRLLAMGTFIVFGYVKGFQPLVGYNYGAKNYNRVKEATFFSLKWVTLFCVITGIFMTMFSKTIILQFSKNDLLVIDIGIKMLRVNGIMFLFFGFQMVYGSLFLALGKAIEGGFLCISRQGIFFYPMILILPKLIGLNGVIYAQPIADLLTVIVTGLLAIRLHKELNKQTIKRGY